MKPTTLLTLLLTTTATSAATVPARLPPTRPRDGPQLRLLHTLTPSPPSTSNFRLLAASTESTKGGAVLTLPEESTRLSSVQGTFRVPHARVPTTGPTANNPVGVYAASFWVGIDSARSDPSCRASLRAGVDIFYDGTFGGPQTPFAWYQFAPGQVSATGFAGFSVAEGDLVRFTLEAAPAAGGQGGEEAVVVVLAENFGANVTCANNGSTPVQSVRQVLPVTAADGSGGGKLCGAEAAWVVEDFPLAGLPDFPVALTNFTSVTFGAAGVTLLDGTKKDATGAEVLDIHLERQGGRLTSCEVVGGKKVNCARVVGDN